MRVTLLYMPEPPPMKNWGYTKNDSITDPNLWNKFIHPETEHYLKRDNSDI